MFTAPPCIISGFPALVPKSVLFRETNFLGMSPESLVNEFQVNLLSVAVLNPPVSVKVAETPFLVQAN